MKGLKKISILGLATLSLLLPTVTKAEKKCVVHKNYYFFSEIYEISDSSGSIQNKVLTEETHTTNRATYFPTFPEGAEGTKNSQLPIQGRICLKKGDKTDGNVGVNCLVEAWTVEQFYTKQAEIYKKGTMKEFLTEKGSSTYTVYDEENETGDEVSHYFKHGLWYKLDDNDKDITYGGSGVPYGEEKIASLVASTFLPTVEIGFQPATSGRATVRRQITKSDLYDSNNNLTITPADIEWKTNDTRKSALAPALYYTEYQLCEDKYKADIEYFVKENDGSLTSAKEYDKKIVDYSKEGLDDKYTEAVTTPKLSGCTADKAKVNVKIEGKDFYDKVIYTCKANNEPSSNSKTGDALIYFAWAIGLGAIGYSVYYFKKMKKEEV